MSHFCTSQKILPETPYRSLFLGSPYCAPQRAWKEWLFPRRIFLILPIGTAWASQNVPILMSVLQIPPVSLAEDSEVLWRSPFVLVSYSQLSGLTAEPRPCWFLGCSPLGSPCLGLLLRFPAPHFCLPKGAWVQVELTLGAPRRGEVLGELPGARPGGSRLFLSFTPLELGS